VTLFVRGSVLVFPRTPVSGPHGTSYVNDAETYMVVAGDTLYSLAVKLLGSGARAQELADFNADVLGTGGLMPGMVLRIPGTEKSVRVICDPRVVSTREVVDMGWREVAELQILAREWPGDENSLVVWRGQEWQPVGIPMPRDGSPATRHFHVRCQLVTGSGDGGG
jgi:hypothetical protein